MGAEAHISIADALFGRTRRSVLALLFRRPEQRYFVREITRLTQGGQGAVQRELLRLTQAGLLTQSRHGHQLFYQANPQSPVFVELCGLVTKTVGIADVIRNDLESLNQNVSVAFIYGSFASGEQRPDSDVDVMIVGDLSFADAAAALGPVHDKLGREVNPTIYPPPEFAQKVAAGHHFLTAVLDGPKIYLIGGERELAAVAGRQVADPAPADAPGDSKSLGSRPPRPEGLALSPIE
jgi:predicted nucleotidyltransferase